MTWDQEQHRMDTDCLDGCDSQLEHDSRPRSYRKLPVAVEAVRFTGHNTRRILNWSNDKVINVSNPDQDDTLAVPRWRES